MSDNLSMSGLSPPNAMGYRPPRNHQTLLTPELKRRLIIAGGILCGLAVIGAAATFLGRSGGEVPVLLPDDRPIRVKPVDPGGLKIAGIEAGVYNDGESDDKPRLAPAPEAPNPSALRAPPEPVRPATPPVTTSPPAAGPAAPSHPPRTEAAKPPATTPPQNPSARQATSNPTPAAAPARPSSEPAKPPAAASPAKPATPPTTPGRFGVQLVAVQSEGAAQAEWQSLRQRHPDLFGGRQAAITKTERDGKTFWRVRTTGFADLAEARAFCERVRAKGPACAVAEF